MRIALIDTVDKPKFYPVALLKIGAWRKSLNDQCRIFNNALPPKNDFDEIWLTTTFTFDLPHVLGMVREAKRRVKRVFVGGIAATLMPDKFEREGVDVHRGLLPEAEQFHPDYSLLGYTPQYSISHTSRGCIRKCEFCMVRLVEPKYKDRPDWEADLHPDAKQVIFYDNNWLAKKRDLLERDVDILRRLVRSKRINNIDFNQSLDARLMTADLAAMIKGLPIMPIRLAFDGMHEDGYVQTAVAHLAEAGFRVIVVDLLYNFTDTPKDFYYRLRSMPALSMEHDVRVIGFPMRYRPILQADASDAHIGAHWTKAKIKGFKALISGHSIHGEIRFIKVKGKEWMPPIQEFEQTFGKDDVEFERLISYPKIKELSKRKYGAMKLKRIEMNKKAANEASFSSV